MKRLFTLLFLSACVNSVDRSPHDRGKDSPCERPRDLTCGAATTTSFSCPPGTKVWGTDISDTAETWCQTPGGVRHGPYRRRSPSRPLPRIGRFPQRIEGCYRSGFRDGVWSTTAADGEVSIKVYDSGDLTGRTVCRRGSDPDPEVFKPVAVPRRNGE